MGRGGTGAGGVMVVGTGFFQRGEVEAGVKFDEQMVVSPLQQVGVHLVAEPSQQRLKVGVDQRHDEFGYNGHR